MRAPSTGQWESLQWIGYDPRTSAAILVLVASHACVLIYQHSRSAVKSLHLQILERIFQAACLQYVLGIVISADISAFFKGSLSTSIRDTYRTPWNLSPKYPIINVFPDTTIYIMSVWHGFGNTSGQGQKSNARNRDENHTLTTRR